ncbi:MAG: ABC transporter ATP-binding protein, partial [Spirochaetales bacterium]|nr:ABC transporter ATP-binding protein [Spirochaetales bacterium]
EFNLTYIFIAHDLAVIQHISTRVAVMYLGKIVEISEAVKLYEEPLHPYTTALLSAAPIPDPVVERNRQRIILTGDVPSPDRERFGCYFYERCPKRMPWCSNHIPPMFKQGENHEVACWLYDEKRDYHDISMEEAEADAATTTRTAP